jgi:hypothetical protein
LRPYNATSSGGKTLLIPTPFSVKMALLDVLFRERGVEQAKRLWPTLRDLEVAIRLPETLVVNHTFVKILRPKKRGASDDTGAGLVTPMSNTIAFREYVYFSGAFELALRGEQLDEVATLLSHVNYFGKRGGFVQLRAAPTQVESLDTGVGEGWTTLTREGAFVMGGTLQAMDDCGPKMTLEHADIFSGKRLALHQPNGRIIRHIVLPVQVESSSRSYTLYRRLSLTI